MVGGVGGSDEAAGVLAGHGGAGGHHVQDVVRQVDPVLVSVAWKK